MNDNTDHDMNDGDLRRLLPTIDRVDQAPPELVERLWAELRPMLDDGAAGKVLRLVPRTSSGDARRRWAMAVSTAAAVVAVIAGVALLASSREVPRTDPAVADLPAVDTEPPVAPTSTGDPVAPPATVAEACRVFEQTVVGPVPFTALESTSPADIDQLAAWVDGLGILLADIDRIGPPPDSTDQYLSVQLLRTALRAAVDAVEAGSDTDAATALANARRHLDAIQLGDSPLTGCVPAPG